MAKSIETNVPKDEPVFSTIFFGDCVTPYLSDKDVKLISMPLDSIKGETFYAICWPKNHTLKGYESKIMYEDPNCFKDRYLLVEFKRIEP